MKRDASGNIIYLGSVNSFNCIRLPRDITQHFSDCVEYFAHHGDAPFVWHRSEDIIINGLHELTEFALKSGADFKPKIGCPTPYARTQSVISRSGHDLCLEEGNGLFLADHWRMSSKNTDVVIRQVSPTCVGQSYPPSFVQIMERDTWNKKFPNYKV